MWFSTHNTARTSLRTSRTPAEVVAYHIFSLLIYNFVVKCRVTVAVGYQCRRSLMFHVKHCKTPKIDLRQCRCKILNKFYCAFYLSLVLYKYLMNRVTVNYGSRQHIHLIMFHVKHFMNTAESITGRIREPWSNFVTSFTLAAVTERTVWAQRVCANDGLSAREASRNLALFQYPSYS